MFKAISIIFLLLSSAKATDVSLTSQNIRSYPLPIERTSINIGYKIVSKNMDLFNIRDEKVGSASTHGSIGDLNSLDLTFAYGLYEHISIFYNFEYQNSDYASEQLKNKKHDLFAKLNIYQNPSAMMDTFSTDIGFIYNSANDLSISGSNLGISKMTDMSDSSFYMRFLLGSKIKSSILDFYLGLKYTTINSTLNAISYDRNEIALNAGFQYTLELGSFLVETGYEYIRLFNRSTDNIEKSNHIINLTLSKALSQKLLLYVGSKFYLNQYNGIIPYLYNEKTKNEFDQKFGYVTFGLVYNFDFNGLNQ